MSITRRSTLAGAVATAGIAVAAVTAKAEEHPEIHRAIEALEKAMDYMGHAAHDFGGHKVDAMESCRKAIHDLQLAEKYDRH